MRLISPRRLRASCRCGLMHSSEGSLTDCHGEMKLYFWSRIVTYHPSRLSVTGTEVSDIYRKRNNKKCISFFSPVPYFVSAHVAGPICRGRLPTSSVTVTSSIGTRRFELLSGRGTTLPSGQDHGQKPLKCLKTIQKILEPERER